MTAQVGSGLQIAQADRLRPPIAVQPHRALTPPVSRSSLRGAAPDSQKKVRLDNIQPDRKVKAFRSMSRSPSGRKGFLAQGLAALLDGNDLLSGVLWDYCIIRQVAL